MYHDLYQKILYYKYINNPQIYQQVHHNHNPNKQAFLTNGQVGSKLHMEKKEFVLSQRNSLKNNNAGRLTADYKFCCKVAVIIKIKT